MIKSEEVANPSSCLNKAAEDEPLFVLRANDELAPYIVEEWAQCRIHQRGRDDPKALEAIQCANRMREWKDSQQTRMRVAAAPDQAKVSRAAQAAGYVASKQPIDE